MAGPSRIDGIFRLLEFKTIKWVAIPRDEGSNSNLKSEMVDTILG